MRTFTYIFSILICCTLLSFGKIKAQETDSLARQSDTRNINRPVDSSIVYYYYDNSAFSNDKIIIIDTTLKEFQQYDPLKKDYDIIGTTTIIGGPHKNLSFADFQPDVFSIGQENLFGYIFTKDKIKHYTPYLPYSEIFYTMGSEEENLLRVTLGNQLSERLYVGLDLDVESTMGLFTNQRVADNQFELNTAFNTFDKRYGIYANYIRNKFKFGENGGLKNDYTYEDTTILDRQLLAVNLNTATNRFVNNVFVLNQYFTLGATPEDTTGRAKLGRLFLNADMNRAHRLYQDQDTGFYKNYYLDSLETYDSVFTNSIHSSFGWTNDEGDPNQHFGIKAQLHYRYTEYFDGNKTLFFNYLSPQLDVFIKTKRFYTELSGIYDSKLPNNQTVNIGDGNITFKGIIQFNFNKFDVYAGADFFNVSPVLKNWHYYSNHFMWDQTMQKQTRLNIKGGVEYNGYKLSADIVNINNYTYFDENIIPKQYSGSIALLKIRFKKRFLFKKFGADILGLYQSSSNDIYLRVPAFTARGSFYFTFPLFKGALFVHPGFDLTYLTSYYADTYNPALMQFHIQNDKKLDNQIYANIFVNFKIKRARIFVSYTHFNTLWGKYNYFLVTHYPQQDAALKFGIAWRFYK